DTIDASKLAHGVTLDLRPGRFSQPDSGSFTAIAYNVAIENAIGTAYNDTLYASDIGDSTLKGGAGDDTYVLDPGDSAVELAGQGTDTIKIGLSWTLSDVFENLTLTGKDNLTATGNAANNMLVANDGNSTLDGGLGADTMVGGFGDNLYIVDNVKDVVISQGLADDTVISSANFALPDGTAYLILTG